MTIFIMLSFTYTLSFKKEKWSWLLDFYKPCLIQVRTKGVKKVSHKMAKNELTTHWYNLRVLFYVGLILELDGTKSRSIFVLEMFYVINCIDFLPLNLLLCKGMKTLVSFFSPVVLKRVMWNCIWKVEYKKEKVEYNII